MGVNFKVVSGQNYNDIKQEFARLYLDNVPSKIIQEKLGLTNTRYCRLVNQCKEEGLIIKRNDYRKSGRKSRKGL